LRGRRTTRALRLPATEAIVQDKIPICAAGAIPLGLKVNISCVAVGAAARRREGVRRRPRRRARGTDPVRFCRSVARTVGSANCQPLRSPVCQHGNRTGSRHVRDGTARSHATDAGHRAQPECLSLGGPDASGRGATQKTPKNHSDGHAERCSPPGPSGKTGRSREAVRRQPHRLTTVPSDNRTV
jgi:hypothetical protein